MNELLTVAVLTLLAVISPGADFAVITRNSLQYGRGHGVLGACGIALGVQFHVLCALLGLSLLLSRTPWLLAGFKLLGAGYLLYIGYRTFIQPPLAASQLRRTAGKAPGRRCAPACCAMRSTPRPRYSCSACSVRR